VRKMNHSAMNGVVYAMHGDPGIRWISGQTTVTPFQWYKEPPCFSSMAWRLVPVRTGES
jgi:hypothetical protein